MSFPCSRTENEEGGRDCETERSTSRSTTTSLPNDNVDTTSVAGKTMSDANRSPPNNAPTSSNTTIRCGTATVNDEEKSKKATKRSSVKTKSQRRTSNNTEQMDLSHRLLMELYETELDCFGEADDDMIEELLQFWNITKCNFTLCTISTCRHHFSLQATTCYNVQHSIFDHFSQFDFWKWN